MIFNTMWISIYVKVFGIWFILMRTVIGLTHSEETTLSDYWKQRGQVLEGERRLCLGSDLVLDYNEKIANQNLIKYQKMEWKRGFKSPGDYPPNLHFFEGKSLMENSTVFKIIQRMPKGVLLHVHDFGMVSLDYLLNLTYTPSLYICLMKAEEVTFEFSKERPVSPCANGWNLLASIRKTPTGERKINARIRKALSLVVKEPFKVYKCIDDVWTRFQSIFIVVAPLLTYKPVFEQYFYQAFLEHLEDGIMFIQVRTTLPDLYDLDGNTYQDVEVVKALKTVSEKFKTNNPHFYGARMIYAPPRHVTNETMSQYVATFLKIKKVYKDFVLGFDLVGQEDKGLPLKHFIDRLLPLRDNYKFYFHAGETDWYGSDTDENLLDAILLGTRRIGHGYAIMKHPLLMKKVKEAGIALEVSPISNQVLKLVDDIRNHPGAVFGSMSIPMVITNDDPTFWDAKGVSYDWYMAYMGMASKNADLRYLKKLALNSIDYSDLDTDEREDLRKRWNEAWEQYVNHLAHNYIN